MLSSDQAPGSAVKGVSEIQPYLCWTDFSFTLHTLELSTLHIDLIAGKFHNVSPPAEVNTTLEYRSPGDRGKKKKKVYKLLIYFRRLSIQK